MSSEVNIRTLGNPTRTFAASGVKTQSPQSVPPIAPSARGLGRRRPRDLDRLVDVQGGEGLARPFPIAVRKTLTAVTFSTRRREPSFYLGLCGPLLRSALQGGIAYDEGLGLVDPAHGGYGCSPL